MPMSLQGLSEIQRFVKKRQLKLKVVFDPYGDEFKLESDVNFYELNLAELKTFSELGYFNHYPAYFIQRSEGEIMPLRFGYVFADGLKKLINSDVLKNCY